MEAATDIDGVPLSAADSGAGTTAKGTTSGSGSRINSTHDDDADGVPYEENDANDNADDDDVDGVPMDDIDGVPM